MNEKIKKAICVVLVGVMLTSSAFANDWIFPEEFIITNSNNPLVRKPNKQNSFGRCWVETWKCGASAVTESFYSYGTSTEIVYYYRVRGSSKVKHQYVSASTVNGGKSSVEIFNGIDGIKAEFSCNAYRISYKTTKLCP